MGSLNSLFIKNERLQVQGIQGSGAVCHLSGRGIIPETPKAPHPMVQHYRKFIGGGGKQPVIVSEADNGQIRGFARMVDRNSPFVLLGLGLKLRSRNIQGVVKQEGCAGIALK